MISYKILKNKAYEEIKNKKEKGYWDFKSYCSVALDLFTLFISKEIFKENKAITIELAIINLYEDRDINLNYMLNIVDFIAEKMQEDNKINFNWLDVSKEVRENIEKRYY